MPSTRPGRAIQWCDNATAAAAARTVTVTSATTSTGIDTQLDTSSRSRKHWRGAVNGTIAYLADRERSCEGSLRCRKLKPGLSPNAG